MQLTPQTYITTPLEEAIRSGCNLVQPKYSGRWCRIVISRGLARVYDVNKEFLCAWDTPFEACCMLVGDFFSEDRIIAWDCWSICEQPKDALRLEDTSLETFGYRDRYAFLMQQVGRVQAPLKLPQNYPIAQAQDVWDKLDPEETCGLIYRRASDPVKSPIRVARKYKEMPGGLP